MSATSDATIWYARLTYGEVAEAVEEEVEEAEVGAKSFATLWPKELTLDRKPSTIVTG